MNNHHQWLADVIRDVDENGYDEKDRRETGKGGPEALNEYEWWAEKIWTHPDFVAAMELVAEEHRRGEFRPFRRVNDWGNHTTNSPVSAVVRKRPEDFGEQWEAKAGPGDKANEIAGTGWGHSEHRPRWRP